MPKRVGPNSEVVFRVAKPRERPYLLTDGDRLALRIWTGCSATDDWVPARRTCSASAPTPTSRSLRHDDGRCRTRSCTRRNDPVELRRAESTARKRVAEGASHLVVQRWLDFKRREWADETYRKAEFVVHEYLTPALRNKPMSTLATPEVKPVLEAIASHAPNLATKARQHVGGIVTYSVQNGLREDGAALTFRGVVPRHKKGHIPPITRPADIGPVALAIDAYKSPITRAALKLTMLTGLRPGVVTAARWDEVNLKTAEWHIAAERMTMRHDHLVPLPTQTIAVLIELRSFTGTGHHVFPSPARQKTPHHNLYQTYVSPLNRSEVTLVEKGSRIQRNQYRRRLQRGDHIIST